MDTVSNIQFDDWEAEQMQDPEFRAEVEALEPAYQAAHSETLKQWKVLHQSLLDLGETIAEALAPVFQRVTGVDAIHSAVIQLRRVQMYADLTQRWRMLRCLAYWLSDKWPERWLPELRFE